MVLPVLTAVSSPNPAAITSVWKGGRRKARAEHGEWQQRLRSGKLRSGPGRWVFLSQEHQVSMDAPRRLRVSCSRWRRRRGTDAASDTLRPLGHLPVVLGLLLVAARPYVGGGLHVRMVAGDGVGGGVEVNRAGRGNECSRSF